LVAGSTAHNKNSAARKILAGLINFFMAAPFLIFTFKFFIDLYSATKY
jgi:ABC-type methionine transport system permease subunit